jgi:hypothetical protein
LTLSEIGSLGSFLKLKMHVAPRFKKWERPSSVGATPPTSASFRGGSGNEPNTLSVDMEQQQHPYELETLV